MAKIPVLLAEADGNDRWRGWCPFCVKFHHHGSMERIHAAHCHDNPDSPFRETGHIWKRYPREKKQTGRTWLLLAIAVPLQSIDAQKVRQAPTAGQGRADQRLWDSMLEQSKSVNNVSFGELGDRADEMANCMGVVDPENELEYFKTISGITGWKLLRVESFLQRHGMYDQFITEDKPSKGR